VDLSAQQEAVAYVADLRPRAVDLTDAGVQEKLKTVFEIKGIRSVLKHCEELSVTPSNLLYFFEHMDRLALEDFRPTDEDILRCRQRTAGANTTTIYLSKQYFEFHDVGGQKPEQKKWEQIMDGHIFSAILYFVATDEYDVRSGDDPERTKLEMSRRIFGEVCNNDHIDKLTPIMLFLNRSDLFEERISDDEGWKSYKKTFKDYNETREVDKCLENVGDWFMKVLGADQKDRVVNFHQTCALDSDAMKVVWDTVREGIMRASMSKAGFV